MIDALHSLQGLEPRVLALGDALRSRNLMVATAESCTGGLIAAACTSVPGSSDWFERGVVSYSNEAKSELIGVPAALIAAHGAVSEEVARAMAEGLLQRSRAQLAAAVTGIAGPTGGSATKPVGLVWFGFARRAADGRIEARTEQRIWPGDRAAVRGQSAAFVLDRLLSLATSA
ncbi:CinA family protein [Caldimonas sp. KR1-144]|uniref:CinA family protein n=1 Tax=Caldimonas sp. KR1-144 TaxID=3400911 RepID=UPI003C0B317E